MNELKFEDPIFLIPGAVPSTVAGPRGFAFKYEDFTPEQLEALKAVNFIPALEILGNQVILSWTNDKGLPNPGPIDLKGRDMEMQISDGVLQWRVIGGAWVSLYDYKPAIGAEEGRATAEQERALSESGRVDIELLRVAAEGLRADAELARAQDTAAAILAAENVTSQAAIVVQDAMIAINEAIGATNDAIAAKEEAITAAAQASDAAGSANQAAALAFEMGALADQKAALADTSALNADVATLAANTAAVIANTASTITTTAMPALDIDMLSGFDFTKTIGANTAFTISNPVIKKPFRLIISGGTLVVPTFTGYNATWILGSLLADYNPAITNYLWCEIRSAGQIYIFWGA